MYDLEYLKSETKKQMPERRWLHTLGVVQSALELADRYQADPLKAEVAAILHDYCKYWPIEQQRQMIVEAYPSSDWLDYDFQLWHAPIGAIVVQREFAIDDEEILDAIRYHTSGRVQMTQLEKIICLADYIEPGREFPGVERMRELAQHSLELALVAGFDSTINYLLKKGKKIFPLTVKARNHLLDEFNDNHKGGRI